VGPLTPAGAKADPAAPPTEDKGTRPAQTASPVAGAVTAEGGGEQPPTITPEPPALPGEPGKLSSEGVEQELQALRQWCKQQDSLIQQVAQKVQQDEAAWKEVVAGLDKRLGDLEGRLANTEKQVQDVGPKQDALRDQVNKWASAARQDAEAGVRKRVEEVLTQGARRIIQVMLEETPSRSAANRADSPGSTASASAPGLAPVAALNRSDLAENASLEENKGLEKDQTELDGFQREARRWAGQIVKLREEMTAAAKAFAENLSACRKVKESLPAQPQESLKSRQEGLDLVGKMMEHRLTRMPAEEKLQEGPLSACGLQWWLELLASESSERAAKRKIDAQLKQLGDERYQRVTDARNAANGGRDSFKRFLEKQVLVVLDAIDDGQHYAGPVIQQLKEANPAEAGNLETWYKTYDGLRQELLARLETLGVRPMQVQRGNPVDYNRHEPIDVEKDAEMPNEHIKAVTRKGYEYVVEKDGEPLVLRPAQVIVAKN
jgi:molecular chaperone GrpE (heat shock protein)